MTIYSGIMPPGLPCILFNTGGRLELHDEDLPQHRFQELRRLLRASGGSMRLGPPSCPVQLSWIRPQGRSHQERPEEFMICRKEEPLLVAGLAADHAQSTRLWNRLVSLKRYTFRCLDAPPLALSPPRTCPWLGLILMPGALGLNNDHLDALCHLGQTVGQVWLRHHFRPGRATPRARPTSQTAPQCELPQPPSPPLANMNPPASPKSSTKANRPTR